MLFAIGHGNELERRVMVEDAQNRSKQRYTPPKENTMAKEKHDTTLTQVEEQDGAYSSIHSAPELVEDGEKDDTTVHFEATTTASASKIGDIEPTNCTKLTQIF